MANIKRIMVERKDVLLQLPVELHSKVKELALDSGRSVNAELVHLLTQQVKQIEKERKG